MAFDDKRLAIDEACYVGDVVRDKTGQHYEVKAYSLGKIRCIDIKFSDGTLIKQYQAMTWDEMARMIHAALDTYRMLANF